MNLIRTNDLDLIKSVFHHPDIKPIIMDEEVDLPITDSVYWLAAYQSSILCGLIVFFPIYSLAWNPHIAVLPEHRGCGTEIMKAGIRWMFDKTPCNKIIAFPFQPIMLRVYEKSGFSVDGFSPKLLTKGGRQIDCYFVGLSK